MITARKRSLGQGNVFTPVCQSFCSRGDLYMLPLPVFLPGPMFLPGGVPVQGASIQGSLCPVWGLCWGGGEGLWPERSGFPLIRENFETFSSQGNQGKTGVSTQNQGKKFKSGKFSSSG